MSPGSYALHWIIVFLLSMRRSQSFVMRNCPIQIKIKQLRMQFLNGSDECNQSQIIGRRDLMISIVSSSVYIPFNAMAISADTASKDYDMYAENYDELDGGSAANMLGIEDARNKLLSLATGSTLEVGAGTGLNLLSYKYGASGVNKLTLLDVSQNMLGKAKSRANLVIPPGIEVDYVIADATKGLIDAFGESNFDTVVDTFSLCVMGNQGAMDCLKQLKAVVKSKENGGKSNVRCCEFNELESYVLYSKIGRILLLENSRATNQLIGWYQDITAVTAANAGGKGCVYNQDVRSFINDSGLVLESEELYAGGLFRAYVCSRN